jgi:cytoskeletal protein RodZ
MSIVFLAIYIFLWVLALNGASNLIPLLVVPLLLAVLVAFGVWLNRFMGITPRQQHFEQRPDDVAPSPSAPPAPPTSPASSDGDSDESPTEEPK